jgi:hypothetical protein
MSYEEEAMEISGESNLVANLHNFRCVYRKYLTRTTLTLLNFYRLFIGLALLDFGTNHFNFQEFQSKKRKIK